MADISDADLLITDTAADEAVLGNLKTEGLAVQTVETRFE